LLISVDNAVFIYNNIGMNSKTKRITAISLMTALTVIGSYITIPIPELPFTLQTFFALLAGLFLNRKDALISQTVYIALGLIGLPVFAAGGGGIGYILRPTFGYIVCLPFLAFFVSSFKEKNVYFITFVSMTALLLLGGIWLILIGKLYITKGFGILFVSYILFYIPVEAVKGIIAIILYKRLKNILKIY